MFVIHWKMPTGVWKLPLDANEKLDPKDYNVYINPSIKAVTDIWEYGFEECGSYHDRGMIKWPVGIQMTYFNEHGEEKSESHFDFGARVICHEIDHLDGLDMFKEGLGDLTAEVDLNIDEKLWKAELEEKSLEKELSYE